MTFTLSNLPLPPSVNQLYRNVGNGRRCKSKLGMEFEADMAAWAIQWPKSLKSAREGIESCISKRLHLNLNFYFATTRLYTKSGAIKRLDVSNYIKAIEDQLASLLGVDDRIFFSLYAIKLESPNGCHEWVDATIWELYAAS